MFSCTILWQTIFLIEHVSLESLNAPKLLLTIITLIINWGMQILIGYKIPQLAPKHKFIVSTTYILFFTFMITIYSITILLEGLKVAPQKIWMGYLFFQLIGMFIYFANNRDDFCWDNLLK
ncbi:hypothetical protein [Acinetobacter sp. ABJ-A23_2]|uniref:hypothetical protein n=1 Tax=Acinetobacter sp. ABJ-A23_2 TaxID=3376991 RepID=UPI0037CB5E12